MTYDYQHEARAGLELLIKRLTKLAELSSKINHTSGATTFQSDADTVQAVLDRNRPLPTADSATGAERVMLRTGLRILAHNLKAASGTVSALGKAALAEEFRAEAEHIEQYVLPGLEEQVSLSLVPQAASAN